MVRPSITTTHEISHRDPRIHVTVGGEYVDQIAARSRVPRERVLNVIGAVCRSLPPGTYTVRGVTRPINTNGNGFYRGEGDASFGVNVDLGSYEAGVQLRGYESDGGVI